MNKECLEPAGGSLPVRDLLRGRLCYAPPKEATDSGQQTANQVPNTISYKFEEFEIYSQYPLRCFAFWC